jgi:hypothetical protein
MGLTPIVVPISWSAMEEIAVSSSSVMGRSADGRRDVRDVLPLACPVANVTALGSLSLSFVLTM